MKSLLNLGSDIEFGTVIMFLSLASMAGLVIFAITRM